MLTRYSQDLQRFSGLQVIIECGGVNLTKQGNESSSASNVHQRVRSYTRQKSTLKMGNNNILYISMNEHVVQW